MNVIGGEKYNGNKQQHSNRRKSRIKEYEN